MKVPGIVSKPKLANRCKILWIFIVSNNAPAALVECVLRGRRRHSRLLNFSFTRACRGVVCERRHVHSTAHCNADARAPQIGKFSRPNRYSAVAQKFPESHENLSARCDTPWQKATLYALLILLELCVRSTSPGYSGYKSEVKIHWPETAAFLFDTLSQTWKIAVWAE